MDRMRCSWLEYQMTPADVIDDYVLVMRAEAMVSRERNR
jgi:hypothetical protein